MSFQDKSLQCSDCQNDTEMTATAAVHPARCFRRPAPSVAKKPKYPLNLVQVDQCIVVIATVKQDRVDSAILNLWLHT